MKIANVSWGIWSQIYSEIFFFSFQYLLVLIDLWQIHRSFQVTDLESLQSSLRTNTRRMCKYDIVYHFHCIIYCGIYFWFLPVLLLVLLLLIFSREPELCWSVVHGDIFCFGIISLWGFTSFWNLTVAVVTFWTIIIMSPHCPNIFQSKSHYLSFGCVFPQHCHMDGLQ